MEDAAKETWRWPWTYINFRCKIRSRKNGHGWLGKGGNSRMCAQLKKIRGQRVREYTTVSHLLPVQIRLHQSKHRTYSAERRSGAIHTIHALVARTVLSLLAGRIFVPENPERTQRSEVQVVLREEMTHVGCRRAEACTNEYIL